MQRAVDRVSEAIQPHDEAIAARARGAQGHDMDATAGYQHGVLAWVWVMVHPPVACLMGHVSRSRAAVAALVERWAGMVVSDG
jgi:transposase